jgi:hypothetical protein
MAWSHRKCAGFQSRNFGIGCAGVPYSARAVLPFFERDPDDPAGGELVRMGDVESFLEKPGEPPRGTSSCRRSRSHLSLRCSWGGAFRASGCGSCTGFQQSGLGVLNFAFFAAGRGMDRFLGGALLGHCISSRSSSPVRSPGPRCSRALRTRERLLAARDSRHREAGQSARRMAWPERGAGDRYAPGQCPRRGLHAPRGRDLQALRPDAVFIGGDMFDGVKADLDALVEPWKDSPLPRGLLCQRQSRRIR